ncbi:MAG: cysteine peptidase family C39 domain-containing protein [Terriglobales bacterium]
MNLNPNAIPTIFIAILLFWLGSALGRKAKSKTSEVWLLLLSVLLSVPGCLFVLYYAHFFDRAAWFYSLRAFPHSELAASGLGLIAGVLHFWLQPKTLGEKLVIPTALGLLLFAPFVKSALDPVDETRLHETCAGEVCLQSTAPTCGPCSAATLLKLFGQVASEKELAHECFTYRGGTEIWYIARAFRRRGFIADFVIQPPNRMSPPSPSIAGVVLPGGAGHFIAVLSESGDQITIGDPLKGKLVLSRNEAAAAYHFTGFFLVIRPRS